MKYYDLIPIKESENAIEDEWFYNSFGIIRTEAYILINLFPIYL